MRAFVHGVGCIALRNTNHWMRAGTYGLQAADAGCLGICWTNTQPLMPPWGGKDAKLGNNPIVPCVPRKEGHILLDTAMSQFSLGRLSITEKAGERLPVPEGFDTRGNLTDEPGAIVRSQRARERPLGGDLPGGGAPGVRVPVYAVRVEEETIWVET
jgi:3-dehydro-L-gulonate 2-dehydrogenase